MKVDPSGRVTECAVQQSSGFTLLDSQTCRIFQKRARFEPARDSIGRPVAGTTNSRITWRIAHNNLPIIPWAFRLGVLLGPDGAQTKCSLEVGGALKRRQDPYVLPCPELGGGIAVPSNLARAMSGKKTVLVFDRQFVPRTVHSIDTPPDLKRFTLLGREVVSLVIGGDGTVTGCRKKASEGLFLPNPGACDALVRRRFTKPPNTGTPLTATATVSVYSLRVH
jgi:TonB family protein